MLIVPGVELPSDLVDAQRDARLVIFAGAGVSMGPPSNLPDFSKLADELAGGIAERIAGESPDVFLGRKELRTVDLQRRVREVLGRQDSQPCSAHRQIVKLFHTPASVRLVTTNFDGHFTTALQERHPAAETYCAPALPLGNEFDGLVYLHGAVDVRRSRLVLTDGDFGRAYLVEGWATRFLMDVFRTFPVLFVGYSHNDPVMRYLARGLSGTLPRFALTPPGDEGRWRNLGITPITFSQPNGPADFSVLDAVLERWAARAEMGVFDHQARIVALAEAAPPIDPEESDYLRHALSNHAVLKSFVEEARGVAWLTWADDQGFLAPLVRIRPVEDEGPFIWALWFAQHLVAQHPRESLAFAERNGATLNPLLCDAIAQHLALLNPPEPIPEDVRRLWIMTLLIAPATPASSLARLLGQCATQGSHESAAALLRALIRLQPKFEQQWFPDDVDEPLRLGVGIQVRGDAWTLRQAWSHLRPHVGAMSRALLTAVTDRLDEAYAVFLMAGRAGHGWDPMSYRRAAIEAQDQDYVPADWGVLVDIARDILDWALANDPPLAHHTIELWGSARSQLLIRLAIYGTGRRADLDPNEALAVVQDRGWLYAHKHETFNLLKGVFAAANVAAQRTFVQYSMDADVFPGAAVGDPDVERSTNYERYNVAVWLGRVATESPIAAAHLEALQKRWPDFDARDRPDLGSYVGSGGFGGPESPTTKEELLAMSRQEAAVHLIGWQSNQQYLRGPSRQGLMSGLFQAVVEEPGWSLALADELVARVAWNADIWSTLLHGWRNASLDDASFARVLEFIDDQRMVAISIGGAASFAEHAVDRKDLGLPDAELLERVADRLWVLSTGHEASASTEVSTEGVVKSYHPAKEIAWIWLKGVARRKAVAGDAWAGIPAAFRQRLESLLGAEDPRAGVGLQEVAGRLPFLSNIDRQWSEANVVPLFDWSRNATVAAKAWVAILRSGGWSDVLFDQMQPFIRQTVHHMSALGERRGWFGDLLASAAAESVVSPWYPASWLRDFIGTVDVEDRVRWAETFGRVLGSLSPDGVVAAWNVWLDAYWSDRNTGVPTPLGLDERQAVVGWLPVLRPILKEAVQRLLERPPEQLNVLHIPPALAERHRRIARA